MIPFNIFGHSNTAGDNNEDPIVWVDSSDSSSYTLSGNDVTALMNKGSLGGAMTLNGAVKFANSGFESWNIGDAITKDLIGNFFNENSFTVIVCFDNRNLNSSLFRKAFEVSQSGTQYINLGVYSSNSIGTRAFLVTDTTTTSTSPVVTGLHTMVISYDIDLQEVTILNYDGNTLVSNNANGNTYNPPTINLLTGGIASGQFLGQNNPLHEFRLYDRAFSLTQMQDLQTELNNKYIQLGSEEIVNGDFSNGLTDWVNFDGGLSLNAGGCKITRLTSTSRLYQFGGNIQQNKTYKVSYEILDNNACTNFRFYSESSYMLIDNTVGVHEFTFTRTVAVSNIYFQNYTNNSDITIDNISVKEIL